MVFVCNKNRKTPWNVRSYSLLLNSLEITSSLFNSFEDGRYKRNDDDNDDDNDGEDDDDEVNGSGGGDDDGVGGI